MTHLKRTPPIKIKLNEKEFNSLLEVLNIKGKSDNEKISLKANRLTEKILRYSLPNTNEENVNKVDLRFYPDEIVDMFYVLFDELKDITEAQTNYYEVLLRVRENIKKELNDISE